MSIRKGGNIIAGVSGAGLVCGQTIFSLDPLTNAGLHLLDGTVLPVGGSYDDFITNYIIPLHTAHPERFKTEAEWQAEYAEYGVCGYYVYTEGVSVRLPKVTGKVEGTLDANALGSVVPESLPNIKGSWNRPSINVANAADVFSGCFSYSNIKTTKDFGSSSSNYSGGDLDFDASLSSSTYQDNAPVKEQAIRGYLYIVISTVTKTDIEVDIDQIQTDLNNKVDVSSLSQLDGSLGMQSDRYVDLTIGASDSIYTAPANGYYCIKGTTNSDNTFIYHVYANQNGESIMPSGNINWYNKTGANALWHSFSILKGQKVKISYRTLNDITFRFYYAEGDKNA